MLGLIIMIAAFTILPICISIATSGNNLAEQFEMPPPSTPRVQNREIIQIIEHLLKIPEGWTKEGKYLCHRDAGIRLLRLHPINRYIVQVTDGVRYEPVDLTAEEDKLVGRMALSYEERLSKTKTLQQAKTVAKRLLDKSVLAKPELGGSGEDGSVSVGSEAVAQLSYYPQFAGSSIESLQQDFGQGLRVHDSNGRVLKEFW